MSAPFPRNIVWLFPAVAKAVLDLAILTTLIVAPADMFGVKEKLAAWADGHVDLFVIPALIYIAVRCILVDAKNTLRSAEFKRTRQEARSKGPRRPR